MDFRILGPLTVLRDGVPLDLGPRKQRMLLADLTLAAPRVVPTDRLLMDLWGDDSAGRENALWVYVSRLRTILEPEREQRGTATVLVTRDHGYALDVDADDIDAHRFERGAGAGAALLRTDPAEASRVLTTALAEWRGSVLEEFADEPFARAEVTRLDELRLSTLENRISADLHSGAAGELVGELEALLAAEPLRERFVGQLMLAQYRSGRQADALRSFERYRTRLGEELGLDPSPELRRLEEQVLLHDPRIQRRAGARARALAVAGEGNPFKGLRAFDEEDAATFFGRDRLVADVVRRIAEGQRFVALVGASGSGKSSVVRAGIVPVVRKGGVDGTERWLVARMVPGAHPFAELEAGLLRASLDAPDSLGVQLADDDVGMLRAALRVLPDDGSRLLLVIDQFEELFTLVDAVERDRFLSQLLPLLDDPHGRIVVVVTLRSDLYGRPLAHPAFGTRLGDAVVNVVPLLPDELEAAALEPAAQAGVTLEPALLATLVGDVIGQPGSLPLFQYTLTELFERRTTATLTLADYEAVGGVHGALRARAEELYADLDTDRQLAASQLFLRLVALDAGDAWGRRRVAAAEIAALDVDMVAVQEVVGVFADARLLTLDRDTVGDAPTVEVAHEALLTEWDRLRGWIDDAHDDLSRHVSLRAAIAEWRAAGRDPDYLLTGTRLDDYARWAASSTLRLTVDEQAYVDESAAVGEHRAAAEAERLAAEARLARAARRRLWALVGVLVVAGAAGITALLTMFAPAPPRVGLITMGRDHSAIALQVANGFEQAARELDVRAETVVPVTDPEVEIADFLATEPDLVVVDTLIGPDLGVDVAGLVTDHPDTTFAIIASSGVAVRPFEAPNATLLTFASEEGGFLAGVAAALESRTGVVGFVGATPFVIDDFRAGFEAGARHADPDVTVLSDYVVQGLPAFQFAGPANAAATRLYERGADVVFHAAGEAGLGIHRAALDGTARLGRHLWSIGVDADEWVQVPPPQRAHVLTSVLKRHDRAARLAVGSYLDGTLQGLALDAGNGGMSLADSGGHLAPTTTDRVAAVAAELEAGRIVVDRAVAGPATGGLEPSVRWSVTTAGEGCSGDVPAESTTTVGSTISVGLTNDSSGPVAIEVSSVDGSVSWAQVATADDVDALLSVDLPLAAVAAPARSHAIAFEPTTAGRWLVGCRDLLTGELDPVGLVVVEDVTGPVTAEAAVTATDDECVWDGPPSFDVGDVVRIEATNEAQGGTLVVVATVVPGTDAATLARSTDELVTSVRGFAPEVPPDGSVELLVHVDRTGTWAVACGLRPGDTITPATLFEVG